MPGAPRREVFVAGPRGDHSQIFDHERTINCVFFHGEKLNRAATFAHCFLFASKSGVDQAKHALDASGYFGTIQVTHAKAGSDPNKVDFRLDATFKDAISTALPDSDE